MAWAQFSYKWPIGSGSESLLDQIDGHFNELGMSAYGWCTNELDTELLCFISGFMVQIVEYFHVIGDESERLNDHTLDLFFRVELFDAIANIGFKPGLMWGARSALKDDFPGFMSHFLADQSSGFIELQFIARMICHRFWDAVGREEHGNRGNKFFLNLAEGNFQAVGLGLDEFGVVESHASFFHKRGIWSGLEHRCGDVLSVLTAAAVATEHGSKECDRPFATILLHCLDGACEHRVPVAVPPVDRQLDLSVGEFCFQSFEEFTALLVDGANASKVIVVLGDFKHSFARNVLATEYILKKRHHILGAFRSPEGNHQDRVDRYRIQGG